MYLFNKLQTFLTPIYSKFKDLISSSDITVHKDSDNMPIRLLSIITLSFALYLNADDNKK